MTGRIDSRSEQSLLGRIISSPYCSLGCSFLTQLTEQLSECTCQTKARGTNLSLLTMQKLCLQHSTTPTSTALLPRALSAWPGPSHLRRQRHQPTPRTRRRRPASSAGRLTRLTSCYDLVAHARTPGVQPVSSQVFAPLSIRKAGSRHPPATASFNYTPFSVAWKKNSLTSTGLPSRNGSRRTGSTARCRLVPPSSLRDTCTLLDQAALARRASLARHASPMSAQAVTRPRTRAPATR